MEKTDTRNTRTDGVLSINWDYVDGVFVDCVIWRGGVAYRKYDRQYRFGVMEQRESLFADHVHERGDVCEYPDILIDDGDGVERGGGRGVGCDVARGSGSRTGASAWWR